MPPKFSLQTVLDVRHNRAETLEIEFGKLLNRERRIFQEIEKLDNNKTDVMAKLQEQMSGEMDLFNVAHLRSNIIQLTKLIDGYHEALANLQIEIEGKRRQLIAARQAEETLDILKRKEIKRFKDAEVVRENKELDDIYISRNFQRKNEIEIEND